MTISDSLGSTCIYGSSNFADENFNIKHENAGILSMANSGTDTNGCQFFITCAKCEYLDSKHVVFGKVVDGMLVVRKMENVPIGPNHCPKLPVVVTECGQM